MPDITYMFMLPVLQFLDKTLGSYGWAILGLTLVVRVLVWPLVVASTRSMQRMSLVQPKMKAMQEKYKDDPKMLQQKLAEFYMKNKMNPLGGCLPLLVQLPILFALFATFTGPPFQDKPIPVKVKLVAPATAGKVSVSNNDTSSADSCYVAKDGRISKLVVHPGDRTQVFGRTLEGSDTDDGLNRIDYRVDAVAGELPAEFKPRWRISIDPNAAQINAAGHAVFPAAGQITVEARFPAGGLVSEEKTVPVKIKVLPKEGDGGVFGLGGKKEDDTKEKTAQSEATADLMVGGKLVKVAIEPGESTVTAGKQMEFRVKAVDGELPGNLQPLWKIANDPNAASIDETGKAVFRHPGEITIDAVIPGEAKDEPFYMVSSIGKVAKGMEFLDPRNIDLLVLLVLFGVTMVLSQKVMVTAPPSDPEQAAIQKQTQTMMPIMVVGMFFFFPLPAGVFLYMVASNVIQTLQTWIIMRTPAPPLVDIDDDGEKKTDDGVITVVPKESQTEEKSGEGGQNTVKLTGNKKKEGKKR